jgi:hypothetical protein
LKICSEEWWSSTLGHIFLSRETAAPAPSPALRSPAFLFNFYSCFMLYCKFNQQQNQQEELQQIRKEQKEQNRKNNSSNNVSSLR